MLLLFAVTDGDTAAAFSLGDTLHDGVSKAVLGRVTALRTEPSLGEENGELYPDGRVRLFLTLEVTATPKGESYSIEGVPLAVGKKLSLHGRGAVEAVCLAVQKQAP